MIYFASNIKKFTIVYVWKMYIKMRVDGKYVFNILFLWLKIPKYVLQFPVAYDDIYGTTMWTQCQWLINNWTYQYWFTYN